ncbi:MAG TPA: hypothetical protein VI413_14740 [Paludibacter sp.]
MKKEKNPKVLIPVAAMFLVVGLTFDEMKWLKYIFLIISLVLSIIALQHSFKVKRNKQE